MYNYFLLLLLCWLFIMLCISLISYIIFIYFIILLCYSHSIVLINNYWLLQSLQKPINCQHFLLTMQPIIYKYLLIFFNFSHSFNDKFKITLHWTMWIRRMIENLQIRSQCSYILVCIFFAKIMYCSWLYYWIEVYC